MPFVLCQVLGTDVLFLSHGHLFHEQEVFVAHAHHEQSCNGLRIDSARSSICKGRVVVDRAMLCIDAGVTKQQQAKT